jgi:16S rRNA (cytosine967-C5)-methyltransferase
LHLFFTEAVATAMASLFLGMPFAAKHIQTSEKIISAYEGPEPLHHYLKHFFSIDKKYGSKDRKAIAHACYCYFRLGHSLKKVSIPERIRAAIFLCTSEPGSWSAAFSEEWIQGWRKDLQGRIAFVKEQYGFEAHHIFQLKDHLSPEIDQAAFIIAHLVQPDLHLRARPGKKEKVSGQLSAAGLQYENCGDSCIALPNSTKIEKIITLNRDAVVQDLSSQRISGFLSTINDQSSTIKVWDCCAASGGKSILAVDLLKNIELTVSDVRPSIISNLKSRFREAGIDHYVSFVADLSGVHANIPPGKYDLVICDVPCSGSGTWSRNPEQLYFFKEDKIGYYTDLQQKIVKNVIPAIAGNGYLLYITCSVFREENEEMIDFILSGSSLQLKKMEVLKGYDKKADTMFAALFIASPL